MELALSLSRSGITQSRAKSVLRGIQLGGRAALFAVMLARPGQVLAEAQSQPVQSSSQKAAVQASAMPDAYRMSMLIRTTLIALSQANLTGNYTVLRDLGSPDFQATNSAARLTEAFTDLRRRKLDYSPILFFDPKLMREPSLDEAGRLRLRGFIETRPEQINFDMMFQNVGGDWRLFGLAVQMQPAPAESAATDQKVEPGAKKATTRASAPPKK